MKQLYQILDLELNECTLISSPRQLTTLMSIAPGQVLRRCRKGTEKVPFGFLSRRS
jgi:hypothetical protein